jgi:hypothetical protein
MEIKQIERDTTLYNYTNTMSKTAYKIIKIYVSIAWL